MALNDPPRVIMAEAPVRVCDNGGWTDTWFAGHGAIFNLAVRPGVTVRLIVRPHAGDGERLTIHPRNYGPPYARHPGAPFGPHPLIEAAIDRLGLPAGVAVAVEIFSEIPGGASTGTSAALTVALLGALARLRGEDLPPAAVATLAHKVETEDLGLQSGIQDQIGAAYGGACYIEMPAYPQAVITPILVDEPIWRELDARLLLIYLGRSHVSSAVHEAVIASLDRSGPHAPPLEALRAIAARSRDALVAGDLAAFGAALIANTAAQHDLHRDLVGPEAQRLIMLARRHGALGWKINGAGGHGGSLSILCGPDPAGRTAILAEVAADPHFRQLPTHLSRGGLCVWEEPENKGP